MNGTTYPSATYMIDGGSPGEFSPWMDQDNGSVVYFQTPNLAAANHTVSVTVTNASEDTPYAFDYLLFQPCPDAQTSGMTMRQTELPSATVARALRSGYIVGGVVGGVVVFVLILCSFLFLRARRKPKQPYYFMKPTAEDMLGPGMHNNPSFIFFFADLTRIGWRFTVPQRRTLSHFYLTALFTIFPSNTAEHSTFIHFWRKKVEGCFRTAPSLFAALFSGNVIVSLTQAIAMTLF